MNTVKITGRLTADVVVKETKAGAKVATFTLADNRYQNGKRVIGADGKPVVQYVNCAVFGKAVETASEFKKGDLVTGNGHIQITTNKVGDKFYNNTAIALYAVEKYTKQDADAPEEA